MDTNGYRKLYLGEYETYIKGYTPEGGCPSERGCDNNIDVDVNSTIKN